MWFNIQENIKKIALNNIKLFIEKGEKCTGEEDKVEKKPVVHNVTNFESAKEKIK